jgi:hypothetical protein
LGASGLARRYRVIIGDDGVRLAKEDAALVAESRAETGEVTTIKRHPELPPWRQLRLTPGD